MNELYFAKMTRAEACSWRANIGSAVRSLRDLLFLGYERAAWEALGYANWTECIKAIAKENGLSERRLWQLHAANQAEQAIAKSLLNNVQSVGQIPEGQLRPLTTLPPEEQATVWQAAVETAPGGKVTAAHVADVVKVYQEKQRQEEKRATRQQRREEREAEDAAALATLPAASARYRLLHGDLADAIAEIEPGSIDVILTDPPYPREYLPVYETLARAAARVLKPGGSLVCMVGQSYLPDVLALMTPHIRYHWTVSYLTPGGQSVQVWPRRVNTFWKPVLWFVNGEYDGRWAGDVTRSATNDNDKRFHHWGQSESGMADLVERFTRPGDTVLDPFLGGGTTGVVSLALGRFFIGMDVDEAAIRTSAARLQEVA